MIVESYEDVIILSGALDSNFWETIHTAISLTLKRNPAGVIIDCSGITECTDKGASTFIDAMEYIKEHDARILVAAVPKNVLDVLRSVPEVRSQLPVVSSVDEARHSLELLPTENGKKSTDRQLRSVYLVCLSSSSTNEYLVHTVQELASEKQAKVCFIFPVIVPRELPLQAPLREEEAIAREIFDRVIAQLKGSQLRHLFRIERARDTISALQNALEEIDATKVFVSLPEENEVDDTSLKFLRSILTKVKKPIFMVRGATV